MKKGGVRIGKEEIYNKVEKMKEIEEEIWIGKDWERDVRVVILVRIEEGVVMDGEIKERIRKKIRKGEKKRNVKEKIIEVRDIKRKK